MERLVIGKVINTRGLKGEIKIENKSDFLKERYKVGNEIYLSNNEKEFITKKIVHFSFHKGFIYLVLEGIDSIETASLYKNYLVYCSSLDLKESDNVYHYLTLKDMEVVFKGEIIGKVIDIDNNTKQDLLRIDTGKKTFLIPFLDEFIINIDKDKRVIEVTNIEVFYEA